MGDRTVHKVWKMIQKRRGQMAGQGQFIGEDRTDCRTGQINVQRTGNRRGYDIEQGSGHDRAEDRTDNHT